MLVGGYFSSSPPLPSSPLQFSVSACLPTPFPLFFLSFLFLPFFLFLLFSCLVSAGWHSVWLEGVTVVVSLIQLSWQTSPQGERAHFLKSALSHSGTWFAFRLKPVGTLKSYLWAEGSPSSLRHEGISYCQAKQLQMHKCRQAHTHIHTHTAESWWKH